MSDNSSEDKKSSKEAPVKDNPQNETDHKAERHEQQEE